MAIKIKICRSHVYSCGCHQKIMMACMCQVVTRKTFVVSFVPWDDGAVGPWDQIVGPCAQDDEMVGLGVGRWAMTRTVGTGVGLWDWDDWDNWSCRRLRRLETTSFRRRLCSPAPHDIKPLSLLIILFVLCLCFVYVVKCCTKCGSHHNRSDREHADVVAVPFDPVGGIDHPVVEAQIVEEGDTRRTPPPRRPDHLSGRGPVSMCC